MKYYILGSGSGGNSTVFENDNKELLMIDCGFTIPELKRRMEKYNLNFDSIKALIITHLHSDHSLSLRAFDPSIVYINKASSMSEFNQFSYYEDLEILGYKISTIPASHDSPGTTGFIISYNNEKMTYITDTGYVNESIFPYINNSDIFLIESNHDPRMLMMTKRPMFIKNRILGSNGHLSNEDCALILKDVIGPKTKEIVFIHRSQEANSEEMIFDTFNRIIKEYDIDISKINLKIAKQESQISYLD